MRPTDSFRDLSSPSTNGAGSPNGSPDTKLTVFSPEDKRSKGRLNSSIGRASNGSSFTKIYSVPTPDPFLVPTCGSSKAQLSPTAASFTPIGMVKTTATDTVLDSMSQGLHSVNHLHSQPDSQFAEVGNGAVKRVAASSPYHGAIDDPQNSRRNPPSDTFPERLGEEIRSRALVIENVSVNFTYMSLAGFFNRHEFGTLKGPILTELSSTGKIYIAFADSREAKRAMEKVQLLRPEWRVFPLTAKEYAQHSEISVLSETSNYEGQLVVTVYYDSRNPNLNQRSAAQSLEAVALTFGDIKAFTVLPIGQDNISEFHIEFFNIRDAENFMTTLNGASIDDYVLEVSNFHPDVENKAHLPVPALPPVKGEPSQYETPYPRNASLTPSRPGRTPYMELSPTGRSTIPSGEHAGLMDWMSRSGETILHSPLREPNRFSDLRVTNQNAVDVERIRLGLDVRTTIMLKAIVDETSHGKYDFMYLRIDFANNCNVGYAFINFEDPIDIIDFVKMRAGRTWNCFNSDKVAEVSYATIQGKDCLVQKFRNSSVMLEHPSFRPKRMQIFHTGTGPLMGTEDRFPGPDNPSKMRRSIENAEHAYLPHGLVNSTETNSAGAVRSLIVEQPPLRGKWYMFERWLPPSIILPV
ncbi:hypothetical protein FE257_002608 [Aspergillus nanangensis]|uniref:Mei2-like C-terminal RNA recognition motif domain-containing protein n=1 Tax=Aspergillus nanangensis TaxID=2582783 RepID=A0AAD4CUY8_ASPNN|nr:hypothetical protein FE257_002608 [Aspergillus nanangensis]